MKLKHAALIATVLVIVAGFAMIAPIFFRHNGSAQSQPRVMLAFSVQSSPDADAWCRDLSTLLNTQDLPAAVFFIGQIAEQHPDSLSCFSNKVDIGSQTYSYSDLTAISDYSLKLQAVQNGKAAVDQAGHLSSHIFRAPFGVTDQDIYSLLTRSDIQVDFSYPQQYNVYENGQFVKYEAAVYNGFSLTLEMIPGLAQASRPAVLFFDDSRPVSEIAAVLTQLNLDRSYYVNASDLVGKSLTVRGVK